MIQEVTTEAARREQVESAMKKKLDSEIAAKFAAEKRAKEVRGVDVM